MLTRGIEPTLCGALLAPFGHDAGGVRLVAQRKGDHFLGRGHFEVQRQRGRGLDACDILVADVAAVFAQMRSDAVAADRRDDLRRTHRIRMIAAARVPDGRHVIDVDAQAQARRNECAHQAARLPGLIAGVAASSGGTSSGA